MVSFPLFTGEKTEVQKGTGSEVQAGFLRLIRKDSEDLSGGLEESVLAC